MIKDIQNIIKLLNLAVISGIVSGLFFAFVHIIKNRYLDYGAYNIALLDSIAYIKDYLLIFLLFALVVWIINTVLLHVFHNERLKRFHENNHQKNLSISLSYSVMLVLLLALFLYSTYPEIIQYLKSTPLANSLHKLTKSIEETKRIFIFITSVSGFLFLVLSTYLLSKFKLADKVHSRLMRIADSEVTKSLGFALLALVIILNIFVFGYKKINSPSGPNILLISIDTLRADHISSYSHYRKTTPNIDKLADKGILFENAYSQGPWTYPSMASMHTSLYPSQVSIFNLNTSIHSAHTTLAEYMKNNFYNTHAIISNIVVGKARGFSQGFDIFDQDPTGNANDLTSPLVTDRAIEYLTEVKGDKFFLWLHYMDPHHKYVHHPEYNYSEGYSGSLGDILNTGYLTKQKENLDEEDLIYVKDIYDEEISFTDHHIGLVLNKLSELGLSDNTIVIITADHGEEFMERNNFGHGQSLYQELIHVPLIIYVPSDKEIEPKRVKSSVEVRSIARTILDLCGIRGSRIQGKNLLIIAEDEPESYAFSQKLRKPSNSLETIIMENWKLIINPHLGSYELYDMESDPGEQKNLFDSEDTDKTVIKDLISKSSEIEKDSVFETVEVNLNEEDIEKLKALGYIQ